MPRYFLELCYNGAQYSGLQWQNNALSIQEEVEKVLVTRFRKPMAEAGMVEFKLTGSSRTDAGVHALQNYFHFDAPFDITPNHVYNLNAMLPADIAITSIKAVMPGGHCRFDAISREYQYCVYKEKNPFLAGRGYFYPYKTDLALLNEVAGLIVGKMDFSSFSKRNTEVKTFICTILHSSWVVEDGCLLYRVTGNRFLRGMVRGLVGTMLKVCKQPGASETFNNILHSKDCTNVDFSVPGNGLFLMKVNYPEGYFDIPPVQQS
jgi:tRNA pseudouridine38-40 synthase